MIQIYIFGLLKRSINLQVIDTVYKSKVYLLHSMRFLFYVLYVHVSRKNNVTIGQDKYNNTPTPSSADR